MLTVGKARLQVPQPGIQQGIFRGASKELGVTLKCRSFLIKDVALLENGGRVLEAQEVVPSVS